MWRSICICICISSSLPTQNDIKNVKVICVKVFLILMTLNQNKKVSFQNTLSIWSPTTASTGGITFLEGMIKDFRVKQGRREASKHRKYNGGRPPPSSRPVGRDLLLQVGKAACRLIIPEAA